MSLGDGKNVLVFVEVVDGAPVNNAMEALGLGRELAQAKGEEVCAVVIGPDIDAAAEACAKGGADKVFTVAQDAWQLEA
ncbi:MAG: electron transfer flavoprotein subunit alpha/FixB family protein, partial [Peptococcus niger]